MNTLRFKVNGIKVDALINPAVNSFCIGLFVRAGSKFETENNNGITHLSRPVIHSTVGIPRQTAAVRHTPTKLLLKI